MGAFDYSVDRYLIMTKDRKGVFVGRAREYEFRDASAIGAAQINTFSTEGRAKAAFERSWYVADGSVWDDHIIVKARISYREEPK